MEDEYIKMDYSLESPYDRIDKVNEILDATPQDKLNHTYLTKMADYIVSAMTEEEKKEKKILTENRMVTVNKRETSFEGLIGKLENGEDGIYNMIANDKNIIFQPKDKVTQEEIEQIPELKQIYDSIAEIAETAKNARGKKAFALKKQLIETYKDLYVVRAAYKKPIYSSNLIKTISKLDLDESVTIDENGKVSSSGLINFYDEKHVSAILCNYYKMKESTWNKMNNDTKWLLEDFDALLIDALYYDYPLYYDLVCMKVDGKQNAEIQKELEQKYGIKHSIEYISSLWRKKIPKLIVEKATNNYLEWYYTFKEYGHWKKCSRCGKIKLAHNNFFSKNKTSKDNFYSICKECRNKRGNRD